MLSKNETSDLKSKAVTGFAWVTMFSVVSRGVQFLSYLILASILFPEDFGIFALAVVLINALYMFREMGLTPALIQKHDDVNRTFGVGLTLLILYGLGLFIVIYFLAIPFAWIVNNEKIIPLLRILALSIPISSIGVLPSVWFQREINFKLKAFPEVVAAFFGAALSVVLALNGKGVWSLVWGRVIYESALTICLWAITGIRWKPIWDKYEAARLFKFGSTVSLGAVLIFVYYLIDQTLVGKYMGEESLGYYSFAFKIGTLTAISIILPLSMVMLPVMIRIKENADKFRDVIGKNISINALVSISIAAGIYVFSENLLLIFYGDKWIDAVLMIKLFSIYGVIWSAATPVMNVFLALKEARYYFYLQLFKIIIAVVGAFWAVKTGVPDAVALVFTIGWFLSCIYGYYKVSRLMNLSIFYFIKYNLPFLISLIPAIISKEILVLLGANLFLQITLFYIVYSLTVFLLSKTLLIEMFNLIRNFIHKRNFNGFQQKT